ncbi:MAG: hypothetical protein J5770_03095 [Bacteroidaceae bacterium]|nr:hypothetical protein [Bacteroidaceae bacterium]
MKKIYFGLLATAAFCVVALFTACSSDSKEEPITDNMAGDFKIINASRGNIELENGSVELYKGDVLKIQFSSKYKKTFNTDYSVLVGKDRIAIENNEFVVNKGDETYTFTLNASFDEGDTHLSASKTITVQQKYKVTVPYVLYITEDLKDLVKVNVDFSNEAGKTFPMEELPGYTFETHEDVYTYEDEGFTYYTFNKPEAESYPVHAGPLTAKTVPMLVLDIPYYRFNIDTEIILTYQQKAEVEDHDYNIGREFQRKKASIVSPTEGANDKDWKYTLPVFTGEKMTSKQTRDYIAKIVKEKDVIKLRIDGDGNVTARN